MNRTARYIVSGVLTVVFLFLAFRGTDPERLLSALGAADYVWIGVSFVFAMISHLLRAIRWRYFLDPIKPDIGLRNLFSGVMIGYLLNNVLPRAGEIARPYAIARLENISVSASLGTIVIERIIDIVTFLLLVAVMPLIYGGPLLETFPWIVPAGVGISLVVVLLLAVIFTLMTRRDWTDALVRRLVGLLPRRAGEKIAGAAHSFLDGFLFVRRPHRFAAIGVLSILIWLMYGVMTYTAFFAFGLNTVLDFRAALVVLAISSVGIAVPTPGGVGSYHVLTTQALVRLFGIDQSIAVSYAIVSHAVGYIGVSIVGSYFVWRDNVRVADAVHVQEEQS